MINNNVIIRKPNSKTCVNMYCCRDEIKCHSLQNISSGKNSFYERIGFYKVNIESTSTKPQILLLSHINIPCRERISKIFVNENICLENP